MIESGKTTLDQKRAADALRKIREINVAENDGMYTSYISALPATILMNGLGQALATELAKAKANSNDSHQLIYKHLADWLSTQVPQLNGDNAKFLDRLMTEDQQTYVQAQSEAMAYLGWLKQFSRAFLTDQEG